MTATDYWTDKFGKPETDADKLAIAMMAEYSEHFEHQNKELREALRELLDLGDDLDFDELYQDRAETILNNAKKY